MFLAKSKNKNLLQTIFETIDKNVSSCVTIGIGNYGLEITTEYSSVSNYLFYVFIDRDEFIDYSYSLSNRNSYFTIEIGPILAFLKQSKNTDIEISINTNHKFTISQFIANSILCFCYQVEIEYDIPYHITFYDYDIELDISSKRLLNLIGNRKNLYVSCENGIVKLEDQIEKTYICDGIEKQFRVRTITGEYRNVNKRNDYKLFRTTSGKAVISSNILYKFRDILDRVSTVQLNIMIDSHVRLDILLDSELGTVANIFIQSI